MDIATTPRPPYYAVIFTSVRTEGDNGYDAMAQKMRALAQQQPGFLGVESAREGVGITVSYWSNAESIKAWKAHAEHLEAQALGRERWYSGRSIQPDRIRRTQNGCIRSDKALNYNPRAAWISTSDI